MADEIVRQEAGSSSKKNRKIFFWVGYIAISSLIAFFGTFFFIVLTEKPQLKSPQMADGAADSSLVAQVDSTKTPGQNGMHVTPDSARADSISMHPSNGYVSSEAENAVKENTGPKFALSTAEAAETAEAKTESEAPPDYRQLAKIYSNMDSKAAAKILSKLDDTMVVGILSEMRDRDAADVLTAITPDRAAILSEKLSKLQSRN